MPMQRTHPIFRADMVGSLLRSERPRKSKWAKLRMIVETAEKVWGGSGGGAQPG